MTTAFITREEYLLALAHAINEWIGQSLGDQYTVPPFLVSVGYESGKRGPRSGNEAKVDCWKGTVGTDRSGNTAPQVWIPPTLDDNLEVAEALAHQMVHVYIGKHHGPEFQNYGQAWGLMGGSKTTLRSDFREYLAGVTEQLGPYHEIHGKVEVNARQKQKSMPKVACQCCGFNLRTATMNMQALAVVGFKCPLCLWQNDPSTDTVQRTVFKASFPERQCRGICLQPPTGVQQSDDLDITPNPPPPSGGGSGQGDPADSQQDGDEQEEQPSDANNQPSDGAGSTNEETDSDDGSADATPTESGTVPATTSATDADAEESADAPDEEVIPEFCDNCGGFADECDCDPEPTRFCLGCGNFPEQCTCDVVDDGDEGTGIDAPAGGEVDGDDDGSGESVASGGGDDTYEQPTPPEITKQAEPLDYGKGQPRNQPRNPEEFQDGVDLRDPAKPTTPYYLSDAEYAAGCPRCGSTCGQRGCDICKESTELCDACKALGFYVVDDREQVEAGAVATT